MGIFSKILLTVDFDRTLTDTKSEIPQRNLEAIRFFTENGGAFTVNTGRSLPMSRAILASVPINAPLLVYNGGAAYDAQQDRFLFTHPIQLDQAQTLRRIMAAAGPQRITEIHGTKVHYTFEENPAWKQAYDVFHCPSAYTTPEEYAEPLLKICVCCSYDGQSLDSIFRGSPEKTAAFDRLEAELNSLFDGQLTILRSAPQLLDIQAAGVSKGRAARELAQMLERKILVCVGDEKNDISMLDEADHAFCPSDGAMAPYYNNVCRCDQGAVADVIYKKLPEILGISLDIS